MTSEERASPATIHHLSQRPSVERGRGSAIPPPPTRWKTRVLLPGAVLLGAGALFLSVGAESLRGVTPVEVAPVLAKRVAAGQSRHGAVQASGWLEPDPFPITASALVAGVVSDVLVLEGDAVEAGQVVARLVDDEARLRVAGAEADLERARAVLATAEARRTWIERSNELLIDRRQAVAVGKAQVAAAAAALSELRATIKAQEKELAAMRDEHQRTKALLGQATNEGDVVQLGLRVEGAEAKLVALQRRLTLREAELERARADADAAGAHSAALIEEQREAEVAAADVARERASLRAAEVRLAEARLALERQQIRCPTAGVVMRRLVAPGARLMLEGEGSTSILQLYDPRQLQVRVDVPLADAAKVGLGQEAKVELEVLPERSFSGRVTRVVHQADVQKNTVEFKVALANPDAALKPDMLARVRFLAGTQTAQAPATADAAAVERLFVPEAALIERSEGRAQVWLASQRRGERAVATLRAVELGPARLEGALEVLAGLRLGDEVVVRPTPGLSEGALLRVEGEAP